MSWEASSHVRLILLKKKQQKPVSDLRSGAFSATYNQMYPSSVIKCYIHIVLLIR